ncbi:MAG: energy-coupling factor ABC transporter permease [Chitinivibrionales bacterium]|nr:energy-coupling factor ABC transporter permease [Chitinivibrionales bacterium]
MHMADALLSPLVGVTFWGASAALIGYSAKKIAAEKENAKTPLMGVLGAFIFAAQMINFTIPGTGSSGHIGGGLLLAVLLGPYRAFITIASVLTIQCLFFADGGLLALGCNIFNLGFFPAFCAYPYLYKKLIGNNDKPIPSRLAAACIIATDVGLLLGACSVIIQTLVSGISELSMGTFVLFMIPIHAAIGCVEGLVVWAVIAFVSRTEPAMLDPAHEVKTPGVLIAVLAAGVLVTGGVLAWFASTNPDGLEWSLAKAGKNAEIRSKKSAFTDIIGKIQEKIAFLPDYSFKPTRPAQSEVLSTTTAPHAAQSVDSSGRAGTSAAGIIGSIIVLMLIVLIGLIIRFSPVKT